MLTREAGAVAKKAPTGGEKPKRYGTLIRVSDEFALAVREAASFEGLSIAEFSQAVLLPVARKRFADAVKRRSRKLNEEGL